MRSTRVALVDAQPVFRAGVRGVLEETGRYAVVAQASTGLDASTLGQRHDMDLLLLSILLPDLTGIEVATLLRQQHPHLHIMFLSNERDAATRRRAVDIGAAALLPRDISETELIRAVDRVVAGENLLPRVQAEPAPVTPVRLVHGGDD